MAPPPSEGATEAPSSVAITTAGLKLVVDTVSEGFGARLAYDVSVSAEPIELELTMQAGEPTTTKGRAQIAVSAFKAHALYKNGSRKPANLSPAEAEQISQKTQAKLREAFGESIEITLSVYSHAGALYVAAKVQEQTIQLSVMSGEPGSKAPFLAIGSASLKGLGLRSVKAPLGLMVVGDTIRLKVEGHLNFHAATPA